MKKILHFSAILFIAVFTGKMSQAQMQYNFAATTQPFSVISPNGGGSGATVLLSGVGINTSATDDQGINVDLESISLGFRFYLSGNPTVYRYMDVNTNGYVNFSPTAYNASQIYYSQSSPNWQFWTNGYNNVRDAVSCTYKPMVCAFWDDLVLACPAGCAAGAASQISYKLISSSSPKKVAIEWYRIMRYPDFSGNGALSFQIILTEVANGPGWDGPTKIEINYRNEGVFGAQPSATIGILGTCPGDFYSLSTTGNVNGQATPIASQTVENDNLIVNVGNNQLYRFTPNLTASAVNDDICNSIALNFDINSTCNPTVGTTRSATSQVFTVTGGGAGGVCLTAPSARDVWYTVIRPAAQSTMIISTDNVLAGGVCSSGGVQFQVYTDLGTCAGPILTEIAGGCSNNGGVLNPNNSSLTLTGLPAVLTTYYIRVSGDADAQLDFQICVKNASNDNVCGATDLGVTPGSPPGVSCVPFNSTTIGSTKTRGTNTGSGYLLANSANNFQTLTGTSTPANADTGLVNTSSMNDVWFKFKTSATNTDYVIDTYSGSLADAQMALYAGVLNCGTNPPSSSGTYFRTGTLNNAVTTFPGFKSFIDDKIALTDFMPRIIATNLALNTVYYIRVWRKNLIGGAYPAPTAASSAGTTITCSSTTGMTIGMVVSVTAGTGVFANNPSTTITSIINGTQFTVSAAPTTALSLATVTCSQNEGTFTICVYERPTCGVKATCSVGPIIPTLFASNPNGNFNGTRCSTPIALPNDTNGICYLNAPKIPTIGTNFAPLCGDNYKGPNATYAVTAGVSSTTVTLSSGNTNNIQVGALVYVATTSPGGILAANTTVVSITNATQFVISATPSPVIPVAAASAIVITSDCPLNSLSNTFGLSGGNGLSIPNLTNPMFYRVKNNVLGDLIFTFSNILSPNNNGIRVALYTLSVGGVTPTSPNYSCTGGVWALYSTNLVIQNNNGTFAAAGIPAGTPPFIKMYGNITNNSGVYNPAAATGPNNTEKFTMAYSSLPIGIYYLMVDGASADKAYFDLSLTGSSPNGNGVLPISLVNFTGRSSGGINTLKWVTSSEVNNDYFTLERSFNGNYFEPVAQIDGAGNSTRIINYEFADKKTSVGITYYRLKQTDFNQTISYSEIVALYSKTGKMIEFSTLRPNPASANFYVDLVSYENTTLSFEIRDVSGKIVRQHNASVNQGENSVETSLEGLENGMYFLSVRDEKSGESFTKKLVKQ